MANKEKRVIFFFGDRSRRTYLPSFQQLVKTIVAFRSKGWALSKIVFYKQPYYAYSRSGECLGVHSLDDEIHVFLKQP